MLIIRLLCSGVRHMTIYRHLSVSRNGISSRIASSLEQLKQAIKQNPLPVQGSLMLNNR